MIIYKIKKIKKFASGQSRYCQNCGIESFVLIATIPANQKISQLQYCKDCIDKNKNVVLVEIHFLEIVKIKWVV